MMKEDKRRMFLLRQSILFFIKELRVILDCDSIIMQTRP